jgi:hypothetical protein
VIGGFSERLRPLTKGPSGYTHPVTMRCLTTHSKLTGDVGVYLALRGRSTLHLLQPEIGALGGCLAHWVRPSALMAL